MKAQGKAPVAVRWERLKDRHNVHKQCVDDVINVVQSLGLNYSIIGRDEMHRGLLLDKDFVISVGGDGTVLNVSSFLDNTVPIIGINSDPIKPNDVIVTNRSDERRSKGALCALTAMNLTSELPDIIYGKHNPVSRTRIQCLIRSTYTETRLPPALNDILLCHPIPAAVTRFRLNKLIGNVMPVNQSPTVKEQEVRCISILYIYIWYI